MAKIEERADGGTERGFGTGLRAQLAARNAPAETAEPPRSPSEAIAAATALPVPQL
jgi:hypothetical protein